MACCCCECECECRPLGFLLGLPFALLATLLSLLGAIVWVIGQRSYVKDHTEGENCELVLDDIKHLRILLSCLCPCCICVAVIINVALALIRAPLHVMEWFTSQIPC